MKLAFIFLFLTGCATHVGARRAHTASLYGVGIGFTGTLMFMGKQQSKMVPVSLALTGVMIAGGIFTNPRPEYVYVPYTLGDK